MKVSQKINIYEAENADKVVSDLFSGNLSPRQALEKLRTRLLDLSSRNRMLSYRHPKNRSIQFVDKPNLNVVFNRLIDGKSLTIKYIGDPPPHTYAVKRPDVKTYAQSLGIDVDTEFSGSHSAPTNRHSSKLQSLYYPTELDKLCRKISSQARTVIEETGTNMLYLVFGFLEFYEREDSEKPMLAPLLVVPVAMEKGDVDEDTRTYQYSIIYSGEDLHENQTLREKLNQDFLLQLPQFEEEEELDSYFAKISHAVQKRKHWKVRHQLTLGFLSFGKLAIWNDLDTKKWPRLLTHPLLKGIFAGGSGKGASLFPKDYDIDNHPQGDLPLIYDADSSQHSAVVDVLSGKNMVINGPPGTGKSQTITNIIASVLNNGKKVLFVSEKLAALEVVRHRLNLANLGHFCLELHSHKTQKKKLLKDIQERLDERFYPPRQLSDKLTTLKRHKKELNRYAELMASRVGNELGLTVHEVLWRAERQRQAIGDYSNAVGSMFLADASEWVYDDIEFRRSKLDSLGQIYAAIGVNHDSHPWRGFLAQPLSPGDEEVIGRITKVACSLSKELVESVLEFQQKTGNVNEPALIDITGLCETFQTLPEPPANLKQELLPRLFCVKDTTGRHTRELLKSIIGKVEQARELKIQADQLLVPGCELTIEEVTPIVEACSKRISPAAFSVPLSTLEELIAVAQESLSGFERVVSQTTITFLPIEIPTIERLHEIIKATSPLILLSQTIGQIKNGASTLLREASRLSQSLILVNNIASIYGIDFISSPAAVANFCKPDGIKEVLPGIEVDKVILEKAKQAADYFMSELPISELNTRCIELNNIHNNVDDLLVELAGYAQLVNLQFDNTLKAIAQLVTMSKIAASAPLDLLDDRYPSHGHSRAHTLMEAEDACSKEKAQREQLSQCFYLDAIPNINELKAAMLVFRRGDGYFNIFSSEWRAAKRLFNSICKTKEKLKAEEYEALISTILLWSEHRTSINNNSEFKTVFDPLFKGVDTDFTKIRSLHGWYLESQKEMLKHPGLIELIDLSTLDANKIRQLAALSTRILLIHSELEAYASAANKLLAPVSTHIESTRQQVGWTEYNLSILNLADGLKNVTSILGCYINQDVSPMRALEALNAKFQIISAKSDFEALNLGLREIHKNVDPLLPGIGSIPCQRWDDYLSQISILANVVNSLVDLISEYGSDETTLSDIINFFMAKLNLDNCVKKFATLPSRSKTHNWISYISTIERHIQAGVQLIQLLKPGCAIGRTAKEVVTGLNAKSDTNKLMSEITGTPAAIALLQELFQGLKTDIDSLTATLIWSESVINNRQIGNSSLKSLILSSSAKENFAWVKVKLQNILMLYTDMRSKLNELTEFGSLNWDKWNLDSERQARGDFASAFSERIKEASNNIHEVLPWSKYQEEKRECYKIGLNDFIDRLEQKKLLPSVMGAVFEYVAYRSIGRSLYKSFPELKGFMGATHEKRRSEFIALDQEIIGITGKSIAYEIDRTKTLPNGLSSYRAAERTEMQLLWHELGKQRRHLPIRQLVKRAGRAIQALKPCFMMGPMSVAQYLEQGSVEFDLVVMDEASQLRPAEALGAIARGKQLVIVGDPKQLPPTNFFDRLLDDGDDDDDDNSPNVFAGSESILDICQQLYHPVRTLRWHYRSQHESLIAFSNHHFYNGKLLVFPSPFDRNNRLGLRFRYINKGEYKDRQNVPEALCVVDAVIKHMMKYPEESLGVVTLNLTQRELIEDLIDKKIRNIREAQTFISAWEEKRWPFFVKNLENVQGDERDVIFISTTFGTAPGTDKIRQNFGPISRPDGWRRLNVLFTRARRKIELFTSMLPEDILVDVKTPAGTIALKDYLTFAKDGILATTNITSSDPDSDFEIAVGDMLRNHGYEVVPQLGVAGFFIDLAVRNPDRRGEFLAAVECDGATYHSSRSARDRDRIRQSILESLGWKDRIWRVWSTDWFYDPRRESKRLLTFLEERRRIIGLESAPEYNFDDEFEDLKQTQRATAESASEATIDPTFSITKEDLFVEVGDRVTYCFIDKPQDKYNTMIVETESNPRLMLINENAPLAQSLLDSTVGDEPEMVVKGYPTRILRVLKIQRQEELKLSGNSN